MNLLLYKPTCADWATLAVERASTARAVHSGACVAYHATDGAGAAVSDVVACLGRGEARAGVREAARRRVVCKGGTRGDACCLQATLIITL